MTFSEGKVVSFSAEKGEDILHKMLETDENAKLLGEVALIPHQSRIRASFILNTLYDEKASNHLALDWAYRYTFNKNGHATSDEDFARAGGNDSLIHVDFMFGLGDMNLDGLRDDRPAVPIMRAGEWAFDL